MAYHVFHDKNSNAIFAGTTNKTKTAAISFTNGYAPSNNDTYCVDIPRPNNISIVQAFKTYFNSSLLGEQTKNMFYYGNVGESGSYYGYVRNQANSNNQMYRYASFIFIPTNNGYDYIRIIKCYQDLWYEGKITCTFDNL